MQSKLTKLIIFILVTVLPVGKNITTLMYRNELLYITYFKVQISYITQS